MIVDLMYQGGPQYMLYSVSDTAEYGAYVSGPRVIDDRVRATMQQILGDIQSGEFANEWIAENENGRGKFMDMRKHEVGHQIETVGLELRNTTIFGNSGVDGGGLRLTTGSIVTLTNSVVAANVDTGSNNRDDCFGGIDKVSFGHVQNTTGCSFGVGAPTTGSSGYTWISCVRTQVWLPLRRNVPIPVSRR